jgi:hypothetical protein
MNDHDEAHLFDGAAEDDEEARQDAIKDLLDNWKHEHAFMFVKRRDDEDWAKLVQEVLQA